MASTVRKSALPKAAAPRRRMSADDRRAAMLDKAAAYFARHGFGASTRNLAEAMGVTQALIYKYFKSKDHLVEQVLEHALGTSGGVDMRVTADSLAEDLSQFYRGFVAQSTETKMRLFMRAGLDGLSWPTKRGNALTGQVFLPMIGALRGAAGLPDFAARPAMRGERELVMSLHAGMVFLGIRRHVYNMPMPEHLDDVVGLYVATFLDGAVPAIARLHANGEDSLTAQLMVPAASPASHVTASPGRPESSKT